MVAERLRFWSVLAEEEGRPVTVEQTGAALPVRVPERDLGAALDALLGNVFAHTPEGTPLTVRLDPRAAGGAEITVRDSGPGFDAAGLERGRSGAVA